MINEAQLALIAIASSAAHSLGKALPAIRVEELDFAERFEFLASLAEVQRCLEAYGLAGKIKALQAEAVNQAVEKGAQVAGESADSIVLPDSATTGEEAL